MRSSLELTRALSVSPVLRRSGSGSRTQPRESTTSSSACGVDGCHCSLSRPSRMRTTRSPIRAARGSCVTSNSVASTCAAALASRS